MRTAHAQFSFLRDLASKKAITASQKLEIIASIESEEKQSSVCQQLGLA